MAKSTRAAREKLEAQQRAEAARKRRNKAIGLGALVVALILAIVGVMFGLSQAQKAAPTPTPTASGTLDPSYVDALQHVPTAALDAVGAGTAKETAEKIDGGAALTKDGKPRLVYVGTEYCPFCGMERWALTIALSRFGTFSGLETSVTPANEGSVPTVRYDKATYTSDVLAFDGFETADGEGKPLQKLSADDQAAFDKYNPQGSVPWLYWGTHQQIGASYNGRFLARTGDQPVDPNAVAAKLSDPNSDEAKAILGAANVHTAQICRLTNNQPGDVCSSPGVQAAAKVLS